MKPHENLKAWRDGIDLVKDIYAITRGFSKEECHMLKRHCSPLTFYISLLPH